jgi:peptidoglycan/LPS O-acetylase OafA/YrhL
MRINQKSSGEYLVLMDLLRYLSAISVLVFHLVNFTPIIGDFGFFGPLIGYAANARGVQIFWVISGIAISHVYLSNATSSIHFLGFRFARLYPLHFITLLIVALLQLVSLRLLGESQVHTNNSLAHFLYNLIFISNWGPANGYSFNAPIWSVSIEMLAYVVFAFFISLFRHSSGFILAGCIFLFSASHSTVLGFATNEIVNCFYYFFGGCLLYYLSKQGSKRILIFLILLLGCIIGRDAIPILICSLFFILDMRLILPKTVSRRIINLGSLSYSLYLIHTPIQILLLIALKYFDVRLFTQVEVVIFFVSYFLLLHFLSFLSFKHFEDPARQFLRSLTIRSLK